jgi:hypothetical protein
MHRHLEHHIGFLTSIESVTKASRRGLKSWNEIRRNHETIRKNADIVSCLAPRIQYDIGLSDCRPQPSASALSILKAYPLSVEAMMKRSI